MSGSEKAAAEGEGEGEDGSRRDLSCMPASTRNAGDTPRKLVA